MRRCFFLTALFLSAPVACQSSKPLAPAEAGATPAGHAESAKPASAAPSDQSTSSAAELAKSFGHQELQRAQLRVLGLDFLQPEHLPFVLQDEPCAILSKASFTTLRYEREVVVKAAQMDVADLEDQEDQQSQQKILAMRRSLAVDQLGRLLWFKEGRDDQEHLELHLYRYAPDGTIVAMHNTDMARDAQLPKAGEEGGYLTTISYTSRGVEVLPEGRDESVVLFPLGTKAGHLRHNHVTYGSDGWPTRYAPSNAMSYDYTMRHGKISQVVVNASRQPPAVMTFVYGVSSRLEEIQDTSRPSDEGMKFQYACN